MGSVPSGERGAPALVFDGPRAWRSHITLRIPYGTQALTCIWIKNNRLAAAKPIYNVRVRIEYLHDGNPEFIIQSASWWHDPPVGKAPLTWQTSLDLDANESQCVPVFMQPVAVTNLDPPWPQSALDEERHTRPLRHGRWTLRITVTADGVEPIQGEIEFTVYQEQGEERLSIGCNPPMGAVRLPLEPIATPLRFFHLSALWRWVGGKWQWAPLSAGAATLIRFGEYGMGLVLLILATIAVSLKIAHWKKAHAQGQLFIKVLGYATVLAAFVYSAALTFALKGNDPWSHVPVAWTKRSHPEKSVAVVAAAPVVPAPSPTKAEPKETASPVPKYIPTPVPPTPAMRITGYVPKFVVGTPAGFKIGLINESPKVIRVLTKYFWRTLDPLDNKQYALKDAFETSLWSSLMAVIPKDLAHAEYIVFPAKLPSYFDIQEDGPLSQGVLDRLTQHASLYFATVMLDENGNAVLESCIHSSSERLLTDVDLCLKHN